MEKFFKKYSKTIILILLLISVMLGYYSYLKNNEYETVMNNTYTESFEEAVNSVNLVESLLSKATISKSSNKATENLTEVWKESNLAMLYLSRIPFDNEHKTQTIKFLNQLSDFSYALSRKSMDGKDLSQEEIQKLEELDKYCIDLENTLNQLSDELYSGNVSWKVLNKSNKHDLKFAQEVDNLNVFSNIEENFNEYEGLIYDGAYSEHINNMEKKGLTGSDITEEEAKQKISMCFDNIEKITSNGYIENGNIPTYSFNVKIKDQNEQYGVEISKKGGWVVQIQNDRDVKEEKINEEEANELGKKFLEKIGFPNMKETYFTNLSNIITINYAYMQDDVIVYPDLIKVKIALDNGQILGCETTGYLNSHYERNLKEPKISIEKAKEGLNSKLNIVSQKRAIIPTDWKEEILCYEFKGTVSDKEFLVYINEETGKQENILVILKTDGGTLTI